MTAIIIPSRWQTQPQYAVEVNWASQLTDKAVAIWMPTMLRGGLGMPCSVGRAHLGPPSLIPFAQMAANQNIQEMSLFGVSIRNGTSNSTQNQSPIRVRPSSNTNANALSMFLLSFNSNRALSAVVQYQDFTNTQVSTSGTYLPVASGQILNLATVFRRNTAGGLALYADSTMAVSGDTPDKNVFASANETYASDASGGSNNTGLPTLMAGFWRRALSAEEIAELGRNPWQVFKPLTRRIYFNTGAIGGGSAIPVIMNQYRQRWT